MSINKLIDANLWPALTSIYEHIKLIDQKALVFIALNGSLVGGLYSLHVLKLRNWLFLLGCSALLLLIGGIAASLVAIWPRRTVHSAQKGSIDPARVAVHKSAIDFLDHCKLLDEKQVGEELVVRIHDLSVIDRNKLFWLRVSIVVSALGWLTALSVSMLVAWA